MRPWALSDRHVDEAKRCICDGRFGLNVSCPVHGVRPKPERLDESAPSLAMMIEELGGVLVLQIGPHRWIASPNPTIPFEMDDYSTPRAAVAATYEAMKESK